MTGHEKKMNKRDLHNFKRNNKHHLTAFIPGINNLPSVGTSPMRRGNVNQNAHYIAE